MSFLIEKKKNFLKDFDLPLSDKEKKPKQNFSLSSPTDDNLLFGMSIATPSLFNSMTLSFNDETDANNNVDSESDTIKSTTNTRFNFKCKHCPAFATKFKVHIIEHMLAAHAINLMQCPQADCGKKFKDEWKLKRHLASNREHGQLVNFKNLYDVMRLHVVMVPLKTGFPCPLCPERPGADEFNMNRCMEDNLFFDNYELLQQHVHAMHPKFNLDSYFICKQCGNLFQTRYKLSCHLFNVHSGKRKNRKKKTKPTVAMECGSGSKLTNEFHSQSSQLVDFHMTSVIDSVANGFMARLDSGQVNMFFF